MNYDEEMIGYAQKRYQAFMTNIDVRPYWQWIAVDDPSLCPECARLKDKVFKYDDPIWMRMLQRLHKGCRCRFRAYSENDLVKNNLKVIQSTAIMPGDLNMPIPLI